ncbi:MAG: type III-B CRISPR module RAMP protein Cmr6 [Bacillota bacterium]
MAERGVVKIFFDEKGYGFIKGEREEYFFHISQVQGVTDINEGDAVEFSLGRGKEGRVQAQRINKVMTASRGLSDTNYKLPADTRGILDPEKVDNFYLKLNKIAYFHQDERKAGFELLLTDRRHMPIYQVKPDFGAIDFTAIVQRQESAVRDLGGEIATVEFFPEWRLIIGLGHPSVYETSITLHHLYGIPYLPGSALKGIARSWVISELFGSEKEALHEEGFCAIFGSPKQSVIGPQKGAVHFFDAFPLTEPKVRFDIINPHYSTYYSDAGGTKPPADYDNPVPVFFLTVEDTSFKIFLSAPSNNEVVGKGEFSGRRPLEVAYEWLQSALFNHGIGAKTAVGYGYAARDSTL